MAVALRVPRAQAPPRMAPLAKLPVFLDLAGRRAVVAGGSAAAAWKAELLAACGARVVVLAEAPGEEMLGLVDNAGTIVLEPRAVGAGRLCRCRDRDPGSARRRRGGIIRGCCACRRRAGERDRQAGLLRFPVRRLRQPVAGGGRDLDRRGGTHPGPGYSPPDRDAAARRPRGLGRGGPAAARSDRGRAAGAPTSTLPSGNVSSTSPSRCARAERPGCGSRSC